MKKIKNCGQIITVWGQSKITQRKTKPTVKFVVMMLIMSGIFSCSKKEKTIPPCIENMIRKIESENVWNPPASIWQYSYNGQIVYYIPPRCCDIPGSIIDENCNPICYDAGGWIRNNECEDFFETRIDEKLIWKDTRTYP